MFNPTNLALIRAAADVVLEREAVPLSVHHRVTAAGLVARGIEGEYAGLAPTAVRAAAKPARGRGECGTGDIRETTGGAADVHDTESKPALLAMRGGAPR